MSLISFHASSTSYLLDHHSLLAVLRKRITQSPKIQEKRGMEELREIAKAYYDAGSKEVKDRAYEFYKSMDSDDSGGVDPWEFLAFMKNEGYLQMQNYDFFRILDLDANGTLDFSEVRTLYYITKSGRPFCAFCRQFIPGIYFSCVDCFKSRENSYSICLKCYQSAECSHSHDGRTHFVDNYALLEATRDSRPAQATAASSSQITAGPWNAPAQLAARPWNAPAQLTAGPWNAPVQLTAEPWNAPVQHTRETMISPHAAPYHGPWNAPVQLTAWPWNAPVQHTSETMIAPYHAHHSHHPLPLPLPLPLPPNPSQAIKWVKCGVALQALEVALSIGGLAGACTIM